MSDLLAPLLAVLDDEADSFWCFVGYMERMVRVLPDWTWFECWIGLCMKVDGYLRAYNCYKSMAVWHFSALYTAYQGFRSVNVSRLSDVAESDIFNRRREHGYTAGHHRATSTHGHV